MIRVITYGTFDLFHYGHLELLRRAKELGDYLVVAISSDEFNIVKKKKCVYTLEERMEIVKAIKYVDKVIVEECWNQKNKDIKENKIDIFTIGEDWRGKFNELSSECDVVYLPRTEGVSTTNAKEIIIEDITEIIEAINERYFKGKGRI